MTAHRLPQALFRQARTAGLLALTVPAGRVLLLAADRPWPVTAPLLLAADWQAVHLQRLQLPDVAVDLLDLADQPIELELLRQGTDADWQRLRWQPDWGVWGAALRPFPRGCWLATDPEPLQALWPQHQQELSLPQDLPAAKALRLGPGGEVTLL